METEHTPSLAEAQKRFYQRVSAIVGQDDDINGCGVIGHADATIPWFVLSEMKQVCLRQATKEVDIHRQYQVRLYLWW